MSGLEPNKKSIDEIKSGLPDLVNDELDLYEKQVAKYKAGKIGEIKFQKIRLQLGTYAQRQAGVQMQRIKIPYGGLYASQLYRLAEVSEKYASGFMHLTTRQDVQLYYINIDNVPNMMRELADVGITTREACGIIRLETLLHRISLESILGILLMLLPMQMPLCNSCLETQFVKIWVESLKWPLRVRQIRTTPE